MQARECARHRFEVMVCADLLEQFPGTLERACRMIAVFGGSALQRSHGESMVGARLVIRELEGTRDREGALEMAVCLLPVVVGGADRGRSQAHRGARTTAYRAREG